MFNPWNAPNSGHSRDHNSQFPYVPPWTQFFPQPNWFNSGAAGAPNYNFNMMPTMPVPPVFMGGFPGCIPAAQPPPPPPSANPPPPETPKNNPPPPPPPSHQSTDSSNSNMDFEKEWQKYQESLQTEPRNQPQKLQMPSNNLLDNPDLRDIIEEEEKFNVQFSDWKKQYDSWREQNRNHPDREQFCQYEQQWQQYETQMLEKQAEIRQRKEQKIKSLQPNPQTAPRLTFPSFQQPENILRGQPSASFANRQMHEIRPTLSQAPQVAPQHSQRWNQPGGKGDQVNFGQDINQRFQSTEHFQQQHHYKPRVPQIEPQRPAWQRHQRPLLETPTEPLIRAHVSSPFPRPPCNRFPSNYQGSSRMANIRYKPADPNSRPQQPRPRLPAGPGNIQIRPQAGLGVEHKPNEPETVPLVPNHPRLPGPPRPLLGDPGLHNQQQHQKPLEEPRFGNHRRPPLLGSEFEPDHKRIRMNMPAAPTSQQNFSLPNLQLQSPRERLAGPPRPQASPRLPVFNSPAPPNNPGLDMRPRLQMMGPRFRRQGAAAISQDLQTGNQQEQPAGTATVQSQQKVFTVNVEAQITSAGEMPREELAGKELSSTNKTGKTGNILAIEDQVVAAKTPGNAGESSEGDKLAAPTSYATINRPTDEKPVGETETDAKVISKLPELMRSPQSNSSQLENLLKDQSKGPPGEATNPILSKEFSRPQVWHPSPESTSEKVFPIHSEDHLTSPRGFKRDMDFRGDHHFHDDRYQGADAGGQGYDCHPFQGQWESDQDWRERNWSQSWKREPIVHDYKHQFPAFSEEPLRFEDKDERYPPGMFHVSNNPYVATVIDYGHGELEQKKPPINPRGFEGVPPPSCEENLFKHDQDFRTPLFRAASQEWMPPSMRGPDFGPHLGLRMATRPEEPVIEKIPIETILLPPGRTLRPDHLAIMVRGLPGAGKTHISKLIKEREIKEGGTAPRLLSLDDYFITEVEKVIEDPETGKKAKKMVMEYEYDKALEASYKASFLKSFKKHVDDLYFNFIILDATFDKKLYMDEFWGYAKSKGFQVYVIEVEADVNLCAKRNDHQRSLADIQKIKDGWDETPRHYLQLDAQFLFQEHIEEVEMDNSSTILETDVSTQGRDPEEGEDVNEQGHQKSKWELDTSEQHLDKLDGLKAIKKPTMEEYLQVPEDYEERSSESGKKRVRWADIEERKGLERMRQLGFVVGYTDWEKLSDDSCIERALTKTRYI